MNIQWYPGHMTKAKRNMQGYGKMIDLCIVLLDARVPASSANPDLEILFKDKPVLYILNKSDLADDKVTQQWISEFKKQGKAMIAVSCNAEFKIDRIIAAVKELMKEKIQKNEEKGIQKTIKVMVTGIPNVGKSTFINRMAKRKGAKTGDRPGVTKGVQWIKISTELELLDTPGLLWPRFDDETVGIHLASIGSINDNILDREELVCKLIDILKEDYSERLRERYKLKTLEGKLSYDVLTEIGRNRGFVIRGGEVDTLRAANILLDEYRGGVLGRISLEQPRSVRKM